jgi:hypothetical protein
MEALPSCRYKGMMGPPLVRSSDGLLRAMGRLLTAWAASASTVPSSMMEHRLPSNDWARHSFIKPITHSPCVVVLPSCRHQSPRGTSLAAELVHARPVPRRQLLGGRHQLITLVRLEPPGCPVHRHESPQSHQEEVRGVGLGHLHMDQGYRRGHEDNPPGLARPPLVVGVLE